MATINTTTSFEDYKLLAQTNDNGTSQLVRDPVTGTQTQQLWIRKRDLGQGEFGKVWQEARKDEHGDWQYRAVKGCSELKLKRHPIDYRRELSALAAFSTSECAAWFVNFHGWWRESSNIYIVTEYLRLGDLSKYTQQALSEVEIKEIADNILRGLEIMHSHGFTHRDIKPENILVCQKRPESPRWWVKIADFGISKQAATGSAAALYTAIATLLYCAPEILNVLRDEDYFKTIYSNKVDMWSFGCVLFNLASRGHPAFSIPDLVRFCDGNIGFNPRNLSLHLSEDGKLLIKTLLEADPDKRPSATTVLDSSWLKRPSYIEPKLQPVSITNRTKSSHQGNNVLRNSGLSEEGFNHWLKKDVRNEKKNGTTAIHVATEEGRLDLVKYILEHKELQNQSDIGTIETKDGYSRSSLDLAASYGRLEIAQYLVNRGADKESKCKGGRTPLHTALVNGYPDIATLLIEQGCNVAARDDEGNTPMHWVSKVNRVKAGLKQGFKYIDHLPRNEVTNYEPIVRVLQLLVHHNANLEAKDKWDDTPLHIACNNGPLRLVQCLIGLGADTEAKDKPGFTPLCVSVISGEPEIAQFLIDRGANIRSVNHTREETPLHYASYSVSWVKRLLADPTFQLIGDQNDYYKDVVSAAQVLIKHGANVDARDWLGQTPLHRAATINFSELARLLISNGADIDAKDSSGNTQLHRAILNGYTELAHLLISNGANVEAKCRAGGMPLHWAVYGKSIELTQRLINSGADIEAKDSSGVTPLFCAVYIKSTELADLLVRSGADVEAKDSSGNTPLHHAASENLTELTKLLVNNGADRSATNSRGETPARLAGKKGHKELASWLKSCQASSKRESQPQAQSSGSRLQKDHVRISKAESQPRAESSDSRPPQKHHARLTRFIHKILD